MKRYYARFKAVEIALICIFGCIGIGISGAAIAFAFNASWIRPIIGPIGGAWSLYWIGKVTPEPWTRTTADQQEER